MSVDLRQGDCVRIPLDDDSVDLVFTSPPYEDARTYGEVGFKLKGQDWVDWCKPRFMECLRVCRGLVAWVIQGRTRGYQWSAAPALLMADLHRDGVCLRNPMIYRRYGIPGSGGPDWLRSDYEWIVCATKNQGRLPWSDNTAMGHACKFPPGGAMSNRTQDGRRRNLRTGRRLGKAWDEAGPDMETRKAFGSHRPRRRAQLDGRLKPYTPPERANPGNVIDCGAAGGSNMGSKLSHENEAPFPERLAEFLVRSFCPPGGVALDPMCGSGTTLAVAVRHGRSAVGMDVRQSQIDLSRRRVEATRREREGLNR